MAKLFHFLTYNLWKKKDLNSQDSATIDVIHILYQNNTFSVNLSMNPSDISTI